MIELLKILACFLAGVSFGCWLIYSKKKAYRKGYNDAKSDAIKNQQRIERMENFWAHTDESK